MPRTRSKTQEEIVATAMHTFWRNGFEATSVDDLVRETGASRHVLYADFNGKDSLFEACLEAYRDEIVKPAFGQVEAKGATLADIRNYFEQQIDLAESVGIPGPGCLFANTMTEVAPHNPAVMTLIDAHNERLRSGFLNALRGTARELGVALSSTNARDYASVLVVFTNGLWSVSRTLKHAAPLRRSERQFLKLIEAKIMS